MILAAFVVVFSVQNAGLVTINFAIWQGQVSLAVVLISTFILGALVGVSYYAYTISKSKKMKKLKDTLKQQNDYNKVLIEEKEEKVKKEKKESNKDNSTVK